MSNYTLCDCHVIVTSSWSAAGVYAGGLCLERAAAEEPIVAFLTSAALVLDFHVVARLEADAVAFAIGGCRRTGCAAGRAHVTARIGASAGRNVRVNDACACLLLVRRKQVAKNRVERQERGHFVEDEEAAVRDDRH